MDRKTLRRIVKEVDTKERRKNKSKRNSLMDKIIKTTLTVFLSSCVTIVGYFIYELNRRDAALNNPVAKFEYTVKEGERLWDVVSSMECYVRYGQGEVIGAIEKLNPGIDPDMIQRGQKIRMPILSYSPIFENL